MKTDANQSQLRSQPLWLVLVALALASTASCRCVQNEPSKSYSLGTNGTLAVNVDSEQRVKELRRIYPDGRLKLKAVITYGRRDIRSFRVFDPAGNRLCETVFSPGTISSTGRNSETPSPGWEIMFRSDESGSSGDIWRDTSWRCDEGILYRVYQVWSDDRSRVDYQVTGPSGIILFTNTYSDLSPHPR